MENKSGMHIISRKLKTELQHYLTGQNRFDQLKRSDIDKAKSMQSFLNREIHQRHSKWQKMSMDDHELLDHLKKVSTCKPDETRQGCTATLLLEGGVI